MKAASLNGLGSGGTSELQLWQGRCRADLLSWKSVLAVEVAVMLVNLPIRCTTSKFWTTNSRVGHTHIACVCATDGSTLLSMASAKQVVLPLPLCACNGHGAVIFPNGHFTASRSPAAGMWPKALSNRKFIQASCAHLRDETSIGWRQDHWQ